MIAAEIDLKNPYPGIRPFKENESGVFFGRDDQINELKRKLESVKFVAVVGVSGTGKSSLVKAGLIPSLLTSKWIVTTIRPSGGTLISLADGLNNVLTGLRDPEFTYINLNHSSLGLVETYKQSQAKSNLLIVVDQFEEIFRIKNAGGEKREHALHFISLLINAVHQHDFPIYVLITLRSDFLGHCVEFKGLPELINDGQFLIPRLSRLQYKDVIIKPLRLLNIEISPSLVSRLLNDIGSDPDQLPVLQHALMLTFNEWARTESIGKPIDTKHYETAGGMANGLDSHCNAIFEAIPIEHKSATIKIFQRLTDINAEGIQIRRPTHLSELVSVTGLDKQVVTDIVNMYRAEGRNFLLPFNGQLESNTVVDIAHESIMRKWIQLNQWILKEEENKRMLIRLQDHFQSYQARERGLLKNPTLSIYVSWEKYKEAAINNFGTNYSTIINWSKRYTSIFPELVSYVNRSKNWDVIRKKIALIIFVPILVVGLISLAYVYRAKDETIVKNEDVIDSLHATLSETNQTLNRKDQIISNDPELRNLDSLLDQIDFYKKRLAVISVNTESRSRHVIDSLFSQLRYKDNQIRYFKKQNSELSQANSAIQSRLSSLRSDSATSHSQINQLVGASNALTREYNLALSKERYYENFIRQFAITDPKFHGALNDKVRNDDGNNAALKNALTSFVESVNRTKVMPLSFISPNHKILIILPTSHAQAKYDALVKIISEEGFQGEFAMDTRITDQKKLLPPNTLKIFSADSKIRNSLIGLLQSKYKITLEPFAGANPSSSNSVLVLEL